MADLSKLTIDQFLSEGAHDIKQPLNVLQMYLGILQRRANLPQEDELGQVVRGAMQQTQAMLNLMSQWARAERDELKSSHPHKTPELWLDLLMRLKSVEIGKHGTTEALIPAHIDHDLVQQTLQDMAHLLPAPVRFTPTVENGVMIECGDLYQQAVADEATPPEYKDALYQLALHAADTIFQRLGLQIDSKISSSGQSLILELRPL